jgi:hypothetical protein
MTDPIQSTVPNASYYPDAAEATAAENAGQVSLSSEHPAPKPSPPPATTPSSPAVKSLVERFEPSTLKAVVACKAEVAAVALTYGRILAAVPRTLGTSVVAIGSAGLSAQALIECIDKDKKAQVDAAKR